MTVPSPSCWRMRIFTIPSNGKFIVPKDRGAIDHVWLYRPEDLVADACSRLPRNLTREEWEQYVGSALPHRTICARLPESEPMPFLEIQSLGSTPDLISDLIASIGVNINLASLDQLDSLPGIGPTIAQRIIDYREQNGPFARIEDLINVPGIGPSTFEHIMDLVSVGSSEIETAGTATPTP